MVYWARPLITYSSEITLLNFHTSLRSQLKNSCFVFHQEFQPPRNIKSTPPSAPSFIRFSVFGTPHKKYTWAVKPVRSQSRLTPVLWYPACQSPYFRRSASPRIPAMPSSAVCPEQMFKTVDIKVTCNNITAMTRFHFWLGIMQRVQTYACIQQNISVELKQDQAVHIT